MPSPDMICAYAERAEELGIDSIWLSDHIVSRRPSLEISAVMAMFAARTKSLKMGPSVLILPARHPVEVAKTYATLDYLTGGRRRVIMAVGLGSDPRDCLACGIPAEERVGRLEEGVAVLRRLWTETNVSHHGRYYHFDDVTIEPRPAHGALDIWIGGRTTPALRRVAKYGDGWFPSFITPEEFRSGMETLAELGRTHGRTIEPGEAGVLLLAHVTANRTEAEAVRQQLASALKSSPDALAVDSGCTKFVLFPVAPATELLHQVETYGRDILPRMA